MVDEQKALGEKIFEMGSEDSERKAARLCLEISEDQNKIQQDWKDRWLEILEGKRKFTKVGYNLACRTLLLSMLPEIPKGYVVDVLADGGGVLVKMKGKNGKIYAQGTRTMGEPLYDFQAMVTVQIRIENTLDRLEGLDEASKRTGLIIPDTGAKSKSGLIL